MSLRVFLRGLRGLQSLPGLLLKQLFLVFLLSSGWGVLSLGGWTVEALAYADDLTSKRALFLRAEAAFNKGDTAQYQSLKKQLTSYVLYPYLLYAEYERRIPSLTAEDFQRFMANYPDTPLANQLRSLFLQNKAKQENWQAFLQAYIPTEDLSLQCHFLWAELQSQNNKEAVLEQVQPLWLSGQDPPKACHKLFTRWEASHFKTRALVWQRIKLAIEKGNVKLARFMKKHITQTENALIELWIMIHNNPYLVTKKTYFSKNHEINHEMIVHGVGLIAKNKPETAIQVWQQLGKEYPFSERHWGLVVRSIGLSFAKQKHPDTYKWLSKVPHSVADTAVHEWRIRSLLEKEDWKNILHWIKQLPPALAQHETWQYWQARALAKCNQFHEAEAIFTKLAKIRSFYGFLASQQIKKPYSISHQPYLLEQLTENKIIQRAGIMRAKELLNLGREAKAIAEWRFVTQKMTDPERQAAASIALKWNLPNWSILALSKAHNKNHLNLRFPMVHSDHILKEAGRNQIDPAFIFAVTRQESAFVSNAKSSAGALGLMQLIPSTAKLVAKQHQLPYKSPIHLFEPATNIRLGTRYLRMMLDSYFNHPALAAAAYNAGPGRVKRWLPEKNVATDAWIETIPFLQTRDYVQNVLTYAVIYQELLGRNPKPIIYPHAVPRLEAKNAR